ncbi:hypothetical protein DBR06_SOUSAS30310053, partial [Sousa chinensis]
CVFMKDFVKTDSQCSKPAVV